MFDEQIVVWFVNRLSDMDRSSPTLMHAGTVNGTFVESEFFFGRFGVFGAFNPGIFVT